MKNEARFLVNKSFIVNCLRRNASPCPYFSHNSLSNVSKVDIILQTNLFQVTSAMSSDLSRQLSDTDQDLLDRIRHEGSASIAQLCDYLQVTATAIRQRLSRLTAAGLIERVEWKQERGRPLHLYQLTPLGLRAMGDNLADLAEALWSEVLAIEDPRVRQTVIDGVLGRLVERYRDQVSGATVTDRLKAIAALFRQRKIPFVVENGDRRAALRIVGCPYPKLKDPGNEICQLEQRLVGELLNAPVALSHCRCDSSGGQCCTFSAQTQVELNDLPGPVAPATELAPAAGTRIREPSI